MKIPTLEETVAHMQAVSGAAELNPDEALGNIEDIDSLDMMEWLYNFQEQYPHMEAQESVFEDMADGTTFRDVYNEIIASAPVSVTAGN